MSEENKWREFYINEDKLNDKTALEYVAKHNKTRNYQGIRVIEYDAYEELQEEKRKIAKDAVVLIEQLKAQNKILREGLEFYAELKYSVEYAYKDNKFAFYVVADGKIEELAGQALADADKVGGG